jgi:hypothetical protein
MQQRLPPPAVEPHHVCPLLRAERGPRPEQPPCDDKVAPRRRVARDPAPALRVAPRLLRVPRLQLCEVRVPLGAGCAVLLERAALVRFARATEVLLGAREEEGADAEDDEVVRRLSNVSVFMSGGWDGT